MCRGLMNSVWVACVCVCVCVSIAPTYVAVKYQVGLRVGCQHYAGDAVGEFLARLQEKMP